MKAFTMPLIKQVYGQDDVSIKGSGDIIKLFSDPDVGAAIEKLKMLSRKLNIKLGDIPKFLEDFPISICHSPIFNSISTKLRRT